MTAQQIIESMGLIPLPGEGGFFKETFRADARISEIKTAGGVLKNRSAGTAIYYMVTPETFSSLHRLPQDEIFHFYLGEAVEMFIIYPDGRHEIVVLGNDLSIGQRPQFVVPANSWQGTRLASGSKGFALMGTTVMPGFEFIDMELAGRSQMLAAFPDKRNLIIRYTHSE